MTADLSGKFTYSSLKSTLKKEGVLAKDMSSALKKVAADNDIDNIKELDKSQTVKISASIFNNAQTQNATNPLDAINSTFMNSSLMNPIFGISDDPFANSMAQPLPFLINPESTLGKAQLDKYATDGDSVINMPEVYNDDDYDVVDYDEFYNFKDGESSDEPKESLDNNADNQAINFEQFKEQFAKTIAKPGDDKNAQNEMLKNMFDVLDTNSDELLDKTELSGAYHAIPVSAQKFDEDYNKVIPTEEEGELGLGNGMMDMDMSNDSFNPQG